MATSKKQLRTILISTEGSKDFDTQLNGQLIGLHKQNKEIFDIKYSITSIAILASSSSLDTIEIIKHSALIIYFA